jgi:Asp/Glu/hydantoin racemase
MIHGYMPRGNVDERLYVPKGQYVFGYVIGVLCIDSIWQPLPPGVPMNASTFDYPVLPYILDGMSEWEVFSTGGTGKGEDQFSPKIKDKIIHGAKELQKQGVRAITGSCGFMADFQQEVASAVDIPVYLSALCQIPWIRIGLKPGQKIGILTADSDLLIPETLSKVGVDDVSDLVIEGAQDYGEFALVRGTHNVGNLNPYKVEKDLATLAKKVVKDNPDIGAMLLECAAMPPYAWAVQNAVDMPVFDLFTLIDWIAHCVVRTPFSGLY